RWRAGAEQAASMVVGGAGQQSPADGLSQVCRRYVEMIATRLDTTVVAEKLPGLETAPVHLRWMLDQIPTLPPLKAHRWLGFVQAALVVHGWTNVQIERNATRGLLGDDVMPSLTATLWQYTDADGEQAYTH